MALITSFYTVLRQDLSDNQSTVLFMTPKAIDALGVMEHLSQHPLKDARRRRHLVNELEGHGKTTDGHPALRSYSQSGGGYFWRVEHTQISPDQVPALEAAARQSRITLNTATPVRDRRRLRS